MAPPAGNILRARVLSSLVLAPLTVAALFAGSWSFAILIAVFVAAGAWEWVRMCGTSPVFIVCGLIVLLAAGATLIWINRDYGKFPALWLLGAVWATDIGAYALGSLVRGPRIAPAISPNKTWAGLGGGIVCAAGWTIGLGQSLIYMPSGLRWQLGLVLLIVLGSITAVVAQAGDFALSFAKRRFGVKDSSGLIPGHGGVLDRIAGLLTTGPALALLLLFGTTT